MDASSSTARTSDDDMAMKNAHLKDNLSSFTENMFNSLLQLINGLAPVDDLNIKKILFVSRLIHALPYTCPNLRACFFTLNERPKLDIGASPTLSKVKSLKQPIDAKVTISNLNTVSEKFPEFL